MAIIRDVKVLQKSEQKQEDFSPVRLLVSLRYNHILLLQCVCDPAGEAAVKVKDSIVEMDVAHVGFYFLYYDIPDPGRYAVIPAPADVKFRKFRFQVGQQEHCIICLINAQWFLTVCIAVSWSSAGTAGIKAEIYLFIRSRKTS